MNGRRQNVDSAQFHRVEIRTRDSAFDPLRMHDLFQRVRHFEFVLVVVRTNSGMILNISGSIHILQGPYLCQ